MRSDYGKECGFSFHIIPSDFGLSRAIEETDILTEYVVTRYYRAPEIMLSSHNVSFQPHNHNNLLDSMRRPLMFGRWDVPLPSY